MTVVLLRTWLPCSGPGHSGLTPWQPLSRGPFPHPIQVYGVFYATSFLDLYRNPKSLTTALHNSTVIVSPDEQYLFLVSRAGRSQTH